MSGKKNEKPKAPPSPQPADLAGAPYSLTAARKAALTVEANAITGLASFPGRLAQRIRRFGEIRLAAERDAAFLIKTPFHDEAPLTLAEIQGQRDRIEFLRLSESQFQALRSTQRDAFLAFETLGAEAAAIKIRLLRTFDLRFVKDPEGRKVVSAIRVGTGDPDLVQDLSDILLLSDKHADYLAQCPRGEAADVARLRVLSPMLSHLLAAKGISEEAMAARRLRDGAYALVVQTESRLRTGATYWYEGTEKMKDYAPFVAPTKGSGAEEDASGEEAIAPADATEPAEAAKPAEPAKPAKAAKPADAAKPAEPAKPAEAAKPAESAKNAKTGGNGKA
jgi:hypothetical protein